MINRTKIERVGGHLLIEGGSYTCEDNCQDVALPVATLRAENRNAREVFIWAEGDPLHLSNVIAHGWTAREVLEVAYGGGGCLLRSEPSSPAGKALVSIDVMAQMKAKNEEIAMLREALWDAEATIRSAIEFGERPIGDWLIDTLTQYQPLRAREAAKVGR